MGIMKLLRGPDVNRGVKEFENAAGAVLLDVRSGPEYRGGHIPGSVNLPLQELNRIWEILDDEQTPLTSIATAAPGVARQKACCAAWGSPT